MEIHRKIARALPVLALAGAGCAAVRRVPVAYMRPQGAAEEARARALGSVLIRIEESPSPGLPPLPESLFAIAARKAYRDASPAADAPRLGELATKALLASGTLQAAVQVGPTGAAFPQWTPASVLTVRLDPLRLTRKRRQPPETKDAQGKPSKQAAVWSYGARLSFQVRLMERPGGGVLASFSHTVERRQELPREQNSRAWYGAQEASMLAEAAELITGALVVRSLVRRRPLLQRKDDPESSEAAEAALRGRWAGAAEVWRRGAQEGRWEDLWDLAVHAERGRRYDEALSLYQKARLAAAGQAPPGASWEEVLSDLRGAGAAAPVGTAGGPPWSLRRLAVLPFSDETASVEGPDTVRRMVQRLLERGGYDAIPLAEVDETLRRHGFTQGGQLRAAEPSQLARWLGADLLIFGHIAFYQFLPLSVVSGRLSLWDARAGRETWAASDAAVDEHRSREAFRDRYKEADSELWRRIRWSPLAVEADWFARQALKGLPLGTLPD